MAIITNPTTILYQPNSLKPYFVNISIKVLMAIMATTKPTKFPTINKLISSPVKVCPSLKNLYNLTIEAPNIIGMAKKNENSAAALRVNFCVIPPTIVLADRDVPGINAKHWYQPMINACLYEISSEFSIVGLLNHLSTNNRITPPITNMTPTISGLSNKESIKSFNIKPRIEAGIAATTSL